MSVALDVPPPSRRTLETHRLHHLSDSALLQALATLVVRDRTTTASLLAHLAEVDDRRLYVPQGYPSLYAYCTEALHFSEESAAKRIRAARAASRFPAIFDMVAEGRLHLSAVVMLHPFLTSENAADLLAAAAHKTKAEIEVMLAERFPRLELSSGITAVVSSAQETTVAKFQPSPGTVDPDPGKRPVARIEAVAPARFTFQVTIDQETRDLLCRAQELLGHCTPYADLETVLARVVQLGVAQLEKRRFAIVDQPREQKPATNARTIPAHVRRAVAGRDGGRCTFLSADGRRCQSRHRLEFDHIVPVARGGQSTMSNIRLRCRAHNQYEAEQTFGAEFMRHKRQAAQAAASRQAELARAKVVAKERVEEVIPYLQALGIKAKDSRVAAEKCESIPDASLEERVKVALRSFAPRTFSRAPALSALSG